MSMKHSNVAELDFLARGGSSSGAFRTSQEGNSRGKVLITAKMR